MTNNRDNAASIINIGKEAARRWGLSDSHKAAGDANAIVALVQASRIVTFSATVERKKEETSETFDFDIVDLPNPYFNSDGSKDTRKMAARTAALAERLFGITELTNANKTALARCIKSAVYLINALADMTDEQLADAVTMKGDKLVAPYGLVKEAPKEDASDNEKAIFEVMQAKPLVLDGKDGASLAELGRRAAPPKANRAAGEAKDKGASLVASVDFVSAVVAQWNNPDGETDNAPSKELEAKLFALSQQIASYFIANPMSEEEEETIVANA